MPTEQIADAQTLRSLGTRILAYHEQHGHSLQLDEREVQHTLNHMTSEVAELWTCVRKGRLEPYEGPGGKPEGFDAEAADVLLVLLGLVTRTRGLEAFLAGVEKKLAWVELHNPNAGEC